VDLFKNIYYLCIS